MSDRTRIHQLFIDHAQALQVFFRRRLRHLRDTRDLTRVQPGAGESRPAHRHGTARASHHWWAWRAGVCERRLLNFEGVEGQDEAAQRRLFMRQLAQYAGDPAIAALDFGTWP